MVLCKNIQISTNSQHLLFTRIFSYGRNIFAYAHLFSQVQDVKSYYYNRDTFNIYARILVNTYEKREFHCSLAFNFAEILNLY